jgi:hypothetical protein
MGNLKGARELVVKMKRMRKELLCEANSGSSIENKVKRCIDNSVEEKGEEEEAEQSIFGPQKSFSNWIGDEKDVLGI